METRLSRIFKDNLFHTAKSPDRDWHKIAERAGDDLYEEIGQLFPHPEIALCAIIKCAAELVLIQGDKFKRVRLTDGIRDAIRELVEKYEKEEPSERDAYDYEKEEGGEEEEDEEDEEGEDGEDEPEGSEQDEPSESGKPGHAAVTGPNQPIPDDEDEESDDEISPDPDESPLKHPMKGAGWNPKKRQTRREE